MTKDNDAMSFSVFGTCLAVGKGHWDGGNDKTLYMLKLKFPLIFACYGMARKDETLLHNFTSFE